MTASEIREMTVDEIRARLQDQEEELANLRLQLATHQLEDGLAVRKARRDVARLKTVLREHELGAESDGAGEGE